MRKLRLLLETNDEIMCYVYSGSVHAQGGPLLVYEPATRPTGSGLYIMPIQNQRSPQTLRGPQVDREV